MNLKNDLEIRIRDKFFGAKIRNSFKYFNSSEQKNIEKNFLTVYNRALDYLRKWYPFDCSPFEKLCAINLDKKLNFEQFLDVAKLVNAKVDEDKLYDELNAINLIYSGLPNLEIIEKWKLIFEQIEAINVFKIVQPVLSITVTNAHVERIFSLMGDHWRKSRNKISISLLRAELSIRMNYDMPCGEFFKFVLLPENKALLEATSSNKKYTFKK